MNKVPVLFSYFLCKIPIFFPIFWHHEFLFSYFFDPSYYLTAWHYYTKLHNRGYRVSPPPNYSTQSCLRGATTKNIEMVSFSQYFGGK